MQQVPHMEALGLSLHAPFPGVGRVDLGCAPAGPSRNAVQDRAVERRVDDLVVGHVCPLFLNTPNLIARPVHGYGAKSRNVQS